MCTWAQHSKTMLVRYDEDEKKGICMVGSTNWTTSIRSNREVSVRLGVSGPDFDQAWSTLEGLWDQGVPLTVGGAGAAAMGKARRSRSVSRSTSSSRA